MAAGSGPGLGLAALLLLFAAGPVAATEPPPALVEATEQAAAECRAQGGKPQILDRYMTARDLNGDGREDFLTDLANLQCGGAWSALCATGGCPVSAWLSEPGDGYTRFDLGDLIGFEIRDRPDQLPQLVAHYYVSYCDDERSGAEHCTRTWTFASNAPKEPPVDPEPAAAAPAVPAARPAPAVPAGWTLRRVPGASPVALGGGTGEIASLAAFCLGGQPFLAVTLHHRAAADAVSLGFAFSQGSLEASAGYEPTAGGAYVVPLAEGPLAARLAGRDSKVAVSIDGAAQGELSLAGSTKAVRGALGDCHRF